MKIIDDEWANRHDAICDEVDQILGPHNQIIFSAFPEDENGMPVNNLNKIVLQGNVQVVAAANPFFGGEDSKNYVGAVLTNPTWLDLMKEANKMMAATLDEHHCFLEGFRPVGGCLDPKITRIELLMGS